MRYVFFLCFLVLSIAGYSQVYNPIPQYVFRNKLGVGRNTPVDSSAYMNIGPNGGAVAGVVLPRVADTLSILGTKRNGLLIFSLQLNKFAYWDSTGARWTEVGSGSGSSGGEVMLMNGSGTVGDSLLFSSVTGDTAYIRNLWFANGLVVENMGDTVLKINIDSSQISNIYTADGNLTGSRSVNLVNYNLEFSGNGGEFGVSIQGNNGGYINAIVNDSVEHYFETTANSGPTISALYESTLRGQKLAFVRALKKSMSDTLYPVVRIQADGGLEVTGVEESTTGNKTKNEISGIVRIAASGTSITVTNANVTASSIVYAQLMTNDTTAWIKNVVPTSGSFTINLGAAATGEVRIGYLITTIY